jgi:predicted AAA+ superfamily ATPase
MTRIQELGQLTTLAQLLADRSGGQVVYASLARTIRVSENTIRNWIEALSSLHYGFVVRPWHKNVSKALRKEPKWFLRDWSAIDDAGKRAETFCASHLLKAVEGWTDLGLGEFELRYVRDKQKREVDFLVVRDGEPWFLAEVKHSDEELSPALEHFQRQLRCDHAFQVVVEADYVDADCFSYHDPVIAPAQTFLSQLL